LEAVVTARRDKAAVERIMKTYGTPRSIISDGLRVYSAAMNEIGFAAERHEAGGRANASAFLPYREPAEKGSSGDRRSDEFCRQTWRRDHQTGAVFTWA
jgi:hypothetical protein